MNKLLTWPAVNNLHCIPSDIKTTQLAALLFTKCVLSGAARYLSAVNTVASDVTHQLVC